MSTVGHGDVYPVTAGRLAAVGMLIVGISVLGAVTATFASWVADRISTRQERTDERILAEVQALRAEVGELRARLDAGEAQP